MCNPLLRYPRRTAACGKDGAANWRFDAACGSCPSASTKHRIVDAHGAAHGAERASHVAGAGAETTE
jgi:hypothetical protein